MEEWQMITIDDFLKIEICCGRIIEVLDFPEAKKPAFKVRVDFGPTIGTKMSSAQLPANYSPEQLVGKLVASVVNLPPRKIGPSLSEVLVLGFPDELGNAVLVSPDREVPLGGRLY
jgi:tRNA-binding protein